VFFGQDRVGEGGRTFGALKFRSMIPDAEARVGAMQATENDPACDPNWPPDARHGDGRVATTLEHLPGGHELRGAEGAPAW